MGIPAFFSYIIKNYKNIVCGAKILKREPVHNLYLDSNSIIYYAYHQLTDAAAAEGGEAEGGVGGAVTDDKIIDIAIETIEQYIAYIQPTKTVFISFDGVAPAAKIAQQRQRRYKTAAAAAAAADAEKDVGGGKFYTIMITPGTRFMELLSRRVKRHFDRGFGGFAAASCIVSTSNDYGEGEHKIFQHMRTHAHVDENTVVYGLDADLIMLAINHIHLYRNIYIFRETAEFASVLSGSGGEAAEREPFTILDIQKLSHYIFRHSNAPPADYIFLCFFLGNDFLPHFPALNIRTNGMDILLQTYKQYLGGGGGGGGGGSGILDKNQIHWRNLKKIFQHIAKHENDLFLEEEKKRARMEEKYSNMTLTEEEKLHHSPIIYRELEKYIYPAEEGWEHRYYRVLFDVDIKENPDIIRDICINYLEGLEWTYKYYSGVCIDWRWRYKYHYPPLIADLVKFMPYFNTDFFTAAAAAAEPLTQQEQLYMVLPPKFHFLMENPPPPPPTAVVGEETPTYIWAYCRYFWESHIVIEETEYNQKQI
jgi:5'-3' exonuclease